MIHSKQLAELERRNEELERQNEELERKLRVATDIAKALAETTTPPVC
jgi:cell division septum initiation protein DivIVA